MHLCRKLLMPVNEMLGYSKNIQQSLLEGFFIEQLVLSMIKIRFKTLCNFKIIRKSTLLYKMQDCGPHKKYLSFSANVISLSMEDNFLIYHKQKSMLSVLLQALIALSS